MRGRLLILGALVVLVLPTGAGAWPTWGNLDHGDCAFAAAANWELLHGGTNATEVSILTEYNEATHGHDEGVDGHELIAYWRTHGIGGKRAVMRTIAPNRLRRIMHGHGAVIVELAEHFAVVRYVTRCGPVLLMWGELRPMTWRQWRRDAVTLYVPSIIP